MSVLFPFAAYIGQAELKRALLVSLVNPKISGVLIVGERGTGKSTLVRSLTELSDQKLVEVPLNTTEDRLIGTIDLSATLSSGQLVFQPGLLAAADQNLLYVDEVNLLSDTITNNLLDVAASGENVVEREGLSVRHQSRFTLIGTMNLEEGGLRPQLLDRFAMMVSVGALTDLQLRREVIRRRLAFEADPIRFRADWQSRTKILADQIAAAKQRLVKLEASQQLLEQASQSARKANVAGHRADILLTQVALTLAALDGLEPGLQQIEEAARYVLAHRRREANNASFEDSSEELHPGSTQNDEHLEDEHSQADQNRSESFLDDGDNSDSEGSSKDKDEIFEVGMLTDISPLFSNPRLHTQLSGAGKRLATRSDSQRGHYVRYRIAHGALTDLALDATLRAAATHQHSRINRGVAIDIQDSDLRQKIRQRRTGASILFVVDASGSMAAQRRMAAVKGAIMGLLNDAYQRRDRVAMIAFRNSTAELVLPFTNALALAERRLRELPTGGRTPLAAGLERAYQVVREEQRRPQGCWPIIVLLSDGRANVAFGDGDASAQALKAANYLASLAAQIIVVDSETGPVRFNLAGQLAKSLEAQLVCLDQLNEDTLAERVRAISGFART